MEKINTYKSILGIMISAAICLSSTGCGSKQDQENDTDKAIPEIVDMTEPDEQAAEKVKEPEKAPASVDYSALFSDRDKNPSFDNITSEVTLSDTSVSISGDNVSAEGSKITISKEGIYRFTGTLTDGQIIVNAPKAKVQLILDNADITCKDSAPIVGEDSDKIFVSLAPHSKNSLSHGGDTTAESDAPDACIYSKDSITVNGSGELTVTSAYCDGIHSKDDVVITGGTLTVNSAANGIKGKDYTAVCGGDITVNSGSDGICARNSTDPDKGFIYIADGNFTVNSANDAFQAETALVIDGGTFDIVTDGGSDNSTKTHSDDFGGFDKGGKGFGGFGGDKFGNKDFESMTPPEGMEIPEDFKNMTPPDGMTPPEGMELPEGFGSMTPPGGFGGGMMPPDGVTGATPENSDKSGKSEKSEKSDKNDNTGTSDSTPSSDSTDDTASDSAKGLKGGSSVVINGGKFTVDSSDDGIHSDGDVTVNGGELTLSAGDDGIHGNSSVTITGGKVTIAKSYEGIEGTVITISGGETDVTASDDGINGSDGSTQVGLGSYSKEIKVIVSGGKLHVDAQGDGIDSNGDMELSGGEIMVDGPTIGANGALDSNGEILVTGGTLVAVGSSGMAEIPGNSSTQYCLAASVDSTQAAGAHVTLIAADKSEIISVKSAKSFDHIVISSPDIKKGETYTLCVDGNEVGSFTADETVSCIGSRANTGFGGGFGGGHGGFGGDFGGDFGGEKPERGSRPDRGGRQLPTDENGDTIKPDNVRHADPNQPGMTALDVS